MISKFGGCWSTNKIYPFTTQTLFKVPTKLQSNNILLIN